MHGNSYYLDNYYNYGASNSSDWSTLPAAVQGILVGLMVVLGIIAIAMLVLQIVGMWKTFKKAGQKGWEAIIPFYNVFTLIRIAGLELWWFIILAVTSLSASSKEIIKVSIGNSGTASFSMSSPWSWGISAAVLALYFAVNYKIAKSFGKTTGFAVGLTLLPPIFWMMLGASNNIKYLGPDGPYKIKYPSVPKK